MTFSSSEITIEREGAIATLWLDRPDKFNAISDEIWRSIPRAMDELAGDDEIRAVVLAGRGPHFCVGLDLQAFDAGPATEEKPASRAVANLRTLETIGRLQSVITAVSKCPMPVVAAIQGQCLGAGVDLVSACDIRVASANSIFSIRETRIGLVADVGTLQRLPKIVSAGHVAEMAYTGKDIDAERAEKIGLVNDVYASFEATLAAARHLAGEIAANSPMAVRGTKFILQQGEDLTTEQSLLLNRMYVMATSLQSNDLKEAIRAIMEKRPPSFSGT